MRLRLHAPAVGPVQLKSALVASTAAADFNGPESIGIDRGRRRAMLVRRTYERLVWVLIWVEMRTLPAAAPSCVGSEVMKVTAVAGEVLTVVRGQEGTTDAAHRRRGRHIRASHPRP